MKSGSYIKTFAFQLFFPNHVLDINEKMSNIIENPVRVKAKLAQRKSRFISVRAKYFDIIILIESIFKSTKI